MKTGGYEWYEPKKIKKRDLSIFLTSTVLLQTSHRSEQADTRRQLEGKVGSKQPQQPKGVWPQSFIRSFPCILQSDMPASKVSNISLMLVKSTESHTLSHISNSSYTESLSVITFNGKHDDP